MPDPRLTVEQMLQRAGRGLGRVDRYGERGATLCSTDEIAAMAMICALAGLKPIYPDSYTPKSRIIWTEGERA